MATLEDYIKEFNVAVANGLIIKARRINRIILAIESRSK